MDSHPVRSDQVTPINPNASAILKNGGRTIIYFHRFSIEYESVQFPGLRAMVDALGVKFEVVYFSMRTKIPPTPELRGKAPEWTPTTIAK